MKIALQYDITIQSRKVEILINIELHTYKEMSAALVSCLVISVSIE